MGVEVIDEVWISAVGVDVATAVGVADCVGVDVAVAPAVVAGGVAVEAWVCVGVGVGVYKLAGIHQHRE